MTCNGPIFWFYSTAYALIHQSTRPTFAIFSEQEYLDSVHDFLDPDSFEERSDEYMQAIGFLALMSGRLPHEIFEDPDWNSTLIWDLRVSNATFKVFFDILKMRL